MSRKILIGDIDTHHDWGLILTKNEIGFPAPKTHYIDIPHGDGALDLSEALTGRINYADRVGSFEFDLIDTVDNRQELVQEITEYLHGKKHHIVLPDEPQWVYKSRLSINAVKTSYYLNKVVLDVVSEPYKLKHNDTVITKNITVADTQVICNNTYMPVIPKIETDKEIKISFKEAEYIINAGVHQLTGIEFERGDNTLTISPQETDATVTITYREGSI